MALGKKTKKEEQETKEKIQKKADELLSGITPSIENFTTKKDLDLITENEKDGGMEWLEEEINRQAEQIAKLKEEIIQYKIENENLKVIIANKPAATIDPGLADFAQKLRNGVYVIYNDLVAHAQFEFANTKILINKFKKEFDFLNR
jgi:hypothetical protein